MTVLTKGASIAVAATRVRAVLGWDAGPGVPDAGKQAHGAATDTITVDLTRIQAGVTRVALAGKIQALVERVLALGMRFDDDGSIDCFLFGSKAHDAGPITMDNYRDIVPALLRRFPLEGGTAYGKAMALMREHYFGSSGPRTTPLAAQPVYVMFVTDGATLDEAKTREQLTHASYEPMFYQFMAIGESSRTVDFSGSAPKKRGFSKLAQGMRDRAFAFLEALDDMTGRHIDNADFFAVSDPANIPDDALFDLLMTEYPGWLAAASSKGLLGN